MCGRSKDDNLVSPEKSWHHQATKFIYSYHSSQQILASSSSTNSTYVYYQNLP